MSFLTSIVANNQPAWEDRYPLFMLLCGQIGRFRSLWKQALLSILFACVAVAQPSEIQTLVAAGNLTQMRWPDFRDYRPSLQKFYESSGNAPAWVQANAASPQSLSMITILRDAWRKGLDPEDYDASRWDHRLQALQASPHDVAIFDVAL